MDFEEIAKEANGIEDEIGLNIDDVLNKLTQELGEFNDCVQKIRGRYCRSRLSLDDLKKETGDVVLNLISVCRRIGLKPELNLFAENTLKRFYEVKEIYRECMKNGMKITICGSIAFHDEMIRIKDELEKLGHEVKLPPCEVKGKEGEMMPVKDYYKLRKELVEDEWVWERKKEAMKMHFDKVEWADLILVLNYNKNNIENYIGSNTLMEMGLAMYLGKKIFLLNDIPEIQAKEEVLGMKPIVINGDLSKIK